MDELELEVLAEKERISKTLQALQETLSRKEKTTVELAAIATFLHNTYNGIENLLKRVLKFEGVHIPVSESYRRDLLNLSVQNKIISSELSMKLAEYLAFRHFFVHEYGITLDGEKLIPLAENLPKVWDEFEFELKKLLKLEEE